MTRNMASYCPICKSLPIVLNEKQESTLQYCMKGNGKVTENQIITEIKPIAVYGICCNCDHEWKIEGITQANQYKT